MDLILRNALLAGSSRAGAPTRPLRAYTIEQLEAMAQGIKVMEAEEYEVEEDTELPAPLPEPE